MAVTSIWRVKGRLSKVLEYIENPEKTTNPEFYKDADPMEVVLAYATDSEKTGRADSGVKERFVTGINCLPATAVVEMRAVKRRYGKEDGTMAYHGYQAFAPGEATPEIAHEIGVKLAQRLWGDRFQVVVTTHLDKDNQLHNHFVLNTVSFADGKKYHRTKQDYMALRNASDDLCREYGLSVLQNPTPQKGKHYAEIMAEREQRATLRSIVKKDVDESIRMSMTERQFYSRLTLLGYEYKFGKYLYLKPPGRERYLRLSRQLGEEYTAENIRKRILNQSRIEGGYGQTRPWSVTAKCRGQIKPVKNKGFRGLYFHYCYLMGVFPRKRRSKRRMHYLLKDDLIKLDQITQEARLLGERRIDTTEQLSSYKAELEAEINAVYQQRKSLYNRQRSIRDEPEENMRLTTEIEELSAQLKQLRKEVRCCDRIAERSVGMEQRIAQIAQEEKQRRELNEHEQQRRRRRTSRQA